MAQAVPAPIPVARRAARLLSDYLAAWPGEAADVRPLAELLSAPDPLDDRRTAPGHLTVGALVLHPERRALLLVRHRALERWLQPGGHLEPGEAPVEAARREAEEETGLRALVLHPWHAATTPPRRPPGWLVPLDIDIHPIPARPARDEPAHAHHDLRYVFRAGPGAEAELVAQAEEVSGLAWEPLDALAVRAEPGLARPARKLLALLDRT